MADTFVLIQVKVSGIDSSVAPMNGLNVKFITNEAARLVRDQCAWISDQYGQPTGLSQTTAVNDEAAHGALITVTDATVRSTQAA